MGGVRKKKKVEAVFIRGDRKGLANLHCRPRSSLTERKKNEEEEAGRAGKGGVQAKEKILGTNRKSRDSSFNNS